MERMDRPIEISEQRKQLRRKALLPVITVVVVVISVFVARAWVRPGLKSSRIRIGVVERGLVEAATQCSGVVEPATEQVLACPFATRVRAVLVEPGERLSKGQALVELDQAEVRLEVERLSDEIALAENRRQELALVLAAKLRQLAGQQEIKQERLAFLATKTEQQQALRELGLTTVFELRQAELDERIARIELRQLSEAMGEEKQSTETRIIGLQIEIGLLGKNLRENQDRLARATVRSESDGVLTWITPDVGASLVRGAVVARVADLSRFRVAASASDMHASRFALAMPVRVEVAEQVLTGRVANIPPAIEKGIMTLNIDLDQPNHRVLRPNMRVDVHVITTSHPDVLRISKGPFVNGSGLQQVFRIRNGSAERVAVEIGVAGIDHYEVLSGLSEDDRVVLSDMKDYQHLTQVRVR